MPLMPRESVRERNLVLPNDYHAIAFPYLFATYRDTIQAALVSTGREFRKAHLRRRMRGRATTDHVESWMLVRPYLDDIESELSKMIARHSAAYWFHLYRRLAPILSDEHDGNTDANTAALVRQISDQAFVKFGSNRSDDLVPISKTTAKTLLGGYFSKGAILSGKSDEEIFQMFGRERWVIEKFELNDFLEIHRLESLFYEYWRTTATLRTIGKGTPAVWGENSDWLTYLEGVPTELYQLYDASFGREEGMLSLLGTWYPQKASHTPGLFFLWSQYNSRQIVREGVQSNFDVGLEPFSQFWAANGFMAAEFQKVNGVSLSALLYLLCAISAATVIPIRYIEDEITDKEFHSLFESNRLNLSMRSYTIFMYSRDEIIEHAKSITDKFVGEGPDASKVELEAAFDFLTYGPEKNKMVSLWAGGQKFPLVPFGEYYLFDIAAINQWREGLFFRVADKIGTKGTIFEDSFRDYITASDINLIHHGELYWPDGSEREADALVRIGDTLVVLECVAAERPMDFEISEPTRFSRRKEILTAKCEQARSLAEQIRSEPVLNGHDFTWAVQIDWYVVSHLHEFIWTTDFPAMESGIARILDPVAMKERLQSIGSTNGSAIS